MRLLFLVVSLALLAACAAPVPAPVEERDIGPRVQALPSAADGYRVQRGDTLYAIAFRYGLDYRDVARWNGIGAPYTIHVGQVLKLRPPSDPVSAAAPTAVAGTGVEVRAAGERPRAQTTARDPAVSQRAPPPERPAPMPDAPDTSAPPAEPVAQRVPGPAPVEAPVESPAERPVEADPEAPLADSVPTDIGSSEPPVGNPAPPVVGLPQGDPDGWNWPTQGRVLRGFRAGDPSRNGLDIAGQEGQPVVAVAPGVVVYSGSGLIGYGELVIVKHSDRLLSAYAHNRRRLVAEGEAVQGGQPIGEMGRNARNEVVLHFEMRENGRPVDPARYLPPRP